MSAASSAVSARSANNSAHDTDDTRPALVELFDTTIQSVCEFGDITLVIEDGYHPQLKLTVNSCILASTSKVFRALFRGCFKEGEAIRAGGREIYMNDKPAPMLALCQLLHLKPVEPAVTQWTMLDFALLVDKFDCVEALKLATDGMLSRMPETPFHDLIVSAHMLDHPNHFRRFTRALVRQSPDIHPEGQWPSSPVLDHLPAIFNASISRQHTAIYNELIYCLTTIVDNYTAASHVNRKPDLSYHLMVALRENRLWPIYPATSTTTSIQDQLKSLSLIELPVICADTGGAYGSPAPRTMQHHKGKDLDWGDEADSVISLSVRSKDSSPTRDSAPHRRRDATSVRQPTARTLMSLAEELNKLCVGLCLDCLKGNETCRSAHPDPWPAYRRRMESFLGLDTEREARQRLRELREIQMMENIMRDRPIHLENAGWGP